MVLMTRCLVHTLSYDEMVDTMMLIQKSSELKSVVASYGISADKLMADETHVQQEMEN